MKKTIYIWIVLVLAALAVLSTATSVLTGLSALTVVSQLTSFEQASFWSDMLLSIGGIIIYSIFFIKLYSLARDGVKWTDITFGYVLFGFLVRIFLFLYFSVAIAILGLLVSIIPALITLVVWITFRQHLKKQLKT